MISDLQVATADDGKRLVLYPLEITIHDFYMAAAVAGLTAKIGLGAEPALISGTARMIADACLAGRAK